MSPRNPVSSQFEPEDATATGNVVDPASGLPRVLSGKCGTCIYRPGNLMHLDAGRREQMDRQANERGSWIICHRTLPAEGVDEQAICRGFWDVNKNNSWGCRLARLLGGPVEVPEPAAPDPR